MSARESVSSATEKRQTRRGRRWLRRVVACLAIVACAVPYYLLDSSHAQFPAMADVVAGTTCACTRLHIGEASRPPDVDALRRFVDRVAPMVDRVAIAIGAPGIEDAGERLKLLSDLVERCRAAFACHLLGHYRRQPRARRPCLHRTPPRAHEIDRHQYCVCCHLH